jgi:hypothetical protein
MLNTTHMTLRFYYIFPDVDAGVLCRHLGMSMSGRATYLPRDWSFVRADAYGVYCHGNETDPHDCHDFLEHEKIRNSSQDFW